MATLEATGRGCFWHTERKNSLSSASSGIAAASNRAPLGSLSGGVLRGHQPQKSRQLADVLDLAPVPNAGHQLASYDPANPGKRLQISDTARQLGVVVAKAAYLSGGFNDLLFTKLQTVEQPIKLKTNGGRTGKFPQFVFHYQRPLAAS